VTRRERGPVPVPSERGETLRQALADALRGEPQNARDLSVLVGIREKDVGDHLAHLARSLPARGERLEVMAASCKKCAFVFSDRERLERPGRCPRCRHERIAPPRFAIRGT
jgi:transcriptional regulator